MKEIKSKEQELENFITLNVSEIKRLISDKPLNISRRIDLDFFAILMSFDPSNDRSKTLDKIATQIKDFLKVSDEPVEVKNDGSKIYTTNQEGVRLEVRLHATENTPIGRGTIIVEPAKQEAP